MIRLPANWRGPGHAEPIDLLRADPLAASRVLAIIGTIDPYTPPADVDDLEAAGATVARYEGADHGFVHDPARPAHRPTEAADAWSRVESWFSV
jgi:carboxymethylenebutenolidase